MGQSMPAYSTDDAVSDYLAWQSYLEAAARHYAIPDQSEDYEDDEAHEARERVLSLKPADALGAVILVSMMLEEVLDGGAVKVGGLRGLHRFLVDHLKNEIDAVWKNRFTPEQKDLVEPFLMVSPSRMFKDAPQLS